jgi:hypothetical protein
MKRGAAALAALAAAAARAEEPSVLPCRPTIACTAQIEDAGLLLGVTADLNRFAAAQPMAPRDAGMLLAISYNVTSWLVLDGGADLGLASGRSLSAFAGFTLSPAHL